MSKRSSSRHTEYIIFGLIIFLLLLIIGTQLMYTAGQSTSEVSISVAPQSTTTPLHAEEAVVIPQTDDEPAELLPVDTVLFEYVEVTDGCGPYFEGECLRVRSGPGLDFPVVSSLRNGVVLKVSGKVVRDGYVWYKVVFDEWLRYPERVTSDWYVAADFVRVLYDEGNKDVGIDPVSTSSQKTITVDRSEQKLYAFEGDELFMEVDISTGIELTPTPRGTFTIFKKTPSRYMQGPLPYLAVSKYYDLPGVPWNLYFTEQGAVIHGAYWHDSFGNQYSSGCVNLVPGQAEELYKWAELGTQVIVKD